MPTDLALPTTAQTFAQLKAAGDNSKRIRKALEIICALAPTTADVPKTLFDASGKITMPAGYLPVGIIDPKGIEFQTKTESDEIEGLGYATAVRVDVIGAPRSLTVTPLESMTKHMTQLMDGADYSNVTMSASGEIVYDEPTLPVNSEWRMLILTRDINKANGKELLDARILPRVVLSEVPSETLAAKGARSRDLTFSVLTDTVLGTPARHILGGTGMADLSGVLGWAA